MSKKCVDHEHREEIRDYEDQLWSISMLKDQIAKFILNPKNDSLLCQNLCRSLRQASVEAEQVSKILRAGILSLRDEPDYSKSAFSGLPFPEEPPKWIKKEIHR